MTLPLPSPPAAIVRGGAPISGRFAGRIDRLDWSPLQAPHRRSRLWHTLHHKRWHYVGLGNTRCFIGVAIVDLGWSCTAFAYLFDRQRRTLLANWRQDGLPRLQGRVGDAPLAGAQAWFRGPGAQLALIHGADDEIALTVHTRSLSLEVALDLRGMPPPLLAVGPIDGGIAHATQKTTALAVQGWAETPGQRFELGDAWAAVDASNGLLARDTAWRWASAHRGDVGFNLQQGYFGAQENVLWLDGQPMALGAARFDFHAAEPLRPWRVHTVDGLLDLAFTPEGARGEDRNLGFAASHYVQPIGTFSGTVRASFAGPAREVHDLLGVTEDHRSRW